jgi:hypothetical protein
MKNTTNKKNNTSNKNEKLVLKISIILTSKTPVIITFKDKALNEVEKKVYWNTDICFSCNKKGYLSASYPEKQIQVTGIQKVSEEVIISETSSSDSENWWDRRKSPRWSACPLLYA